ncbi:MAG: carboxypeptidase-like regulatory domain-containing protein [Chryseolinea sp.]
MKNSIQVLALVGVLMVISAFQMIKTSLGIIVRDETGNIVAGASVQLFENEEDYKSEQNVVAQGVTDEKGFIRLKELKAISYFVIVRKDDKDNSDGGERTAKLDEKRMNKVTVIIQ